MLYSWGIFFPLQKKGIYPRFGSVLELYHGVEKRFPSTGGIWGLMVGGGGNSCVKT